MVGNQNSEYQSNLNIEKMLPLMCRVHLELEYYLLQAFKRMNFIKNQIKFINFASKDLNEYYSMIHNEKGYNNLTRVIKKQLQPFDLKVVLQRIIEALNYRAK